MSRTFAEIIRANGKAEYFEENKELYKTGYIGLLAEGNAEIFRTARTGERAKVRKIRAGDVFGAASLFGEWDSSLSSVISLSQCRVCYLNEKEVKSLAEYNVEFALQYITYLSSRIRFLNARLDTYSSSSSAGRLYEYLLQMSDGEGRTEIKESMISLSEKLKIGRASLYRGIDMLEKNSLIRREKNIFYIL